jgi:hypothetical protein
MMKSMQGCILDVQVQSLHLSSLPVGVIPTRPERGRKLDDANLAQGHVNTALFSLHSSSFNLDSKIGAGPLHHVKIRFQCSEVSNYELNCIILYV